MDDSKVKTPNESTVKDKESTDLELFVGREREKSQVLKNLGNDNFVAIVGNAGVGKTSFVNRRVIPVLEQGFIVRGTKEWKVIKFRPGKKPLASLAAALSTIEAVSGEGGTKVDPNLGRSYEKTLKKKYGIIEILESNKVYKGKNLLLSIDSLDDLVFFTEHDDQDIVLTEVETYVTRLLEVINQSAYPIFIVATLRNETSANFSLFSQLAEVINRHQFILAEMKREELMEDLSTNLTAKTLLSDSLVSYVNEFYTKKPLVIGVFAYALKQSIMLAGYGNRVQLSHMHAVGGLDSTCQRQFKKVCNTLSREQRINSRLVFQAMTGMKEGGNHYIFPVSVTKISESSGIDKQAVVGVLQPFINEKIGLVKVFQTEDIVRRLEKLNAASSNIKDGLTYDSEIVLASEEIIKGVPWLRASIEQEYKNALIYKDLHKSAKSKEPAYEGDKFTRTRRWYQKVKPHQGWANRYQIDFEEVEQFYQKGLVKQQEKDEDAEAKEHARLQNAKRYTNRIIAIVVLIIALVGILFLAEREADKAIKAKKDAELAEVRMGDATAEAEEAKDEAERAKREADTKSKKAKEAEEIARIASEEANTATEQAEIAEKEAKEASSKLKQVDKEFKKNQEISKQLTIENVKSKTANDYLSNLQDMLKSITILDKSLNIGESKKKEENANAARAIFDTYNELAQRHKDIEDSSIIAIKDIVKNSLFSTMQLSYNKVNEGEDYRKIATSVSMAKAKEENTFILVSNDAKSQAKMLKIDPKTKDVTIIPITMDDEKSLNDLGAYKIRYSNSGKHYLISHVPIEKDERFISRYTSKDTFYATQEMGSTIVAIYPQNENDFLVVDQQANVLLLKDSERKELGIDSVYTNLTGSRASTFSDNRLRAVCLDEDSNVIYMAIANNGIVELGLKGTEATIINRYTIPNLKSNEVTALEYVFREGQKKLVIGTRKGDLGIYELSDGQLKFDPLQYFSLEHTSNINCLETRGDYLVSGGRDGVVNVWSLNALEKLRSVNSYDPQNFTQKDAIREVVFVDDQTILVSSSTEGLQSSKGEVSLLRLEFDAMGKALIRLLEQKEKK